MEGGRWDGLILASSLLYSLLFFRCACLGSLPLFFFPPQLKKGGSYEAREAVQTRDSLSLSRVLPDSFIAIL